MWIMRWVLGKCINVPFFSLFLSYGSMSTHLTLSPYLLFSSFFPPLCFLLLFSSLSLLLFFFSSLLSLLVTTLLHPQGVRLSSVYHGSTLLCSRYVTFCILMTSVHSDLCWRFIQHVTFFLHIWSTVVQWCNL